MKTKQHATLKTNGSMKKSKRKSENTSRQIKMKAQPSKNLWGAAKAILRGWQYLLPMKQLEVLMGNLKKDLEL